MIKHDSNKLIRFKLTSKSLYFCRQEVWSWTRNNFLLTQKFWYTLI